MTYTKKVWLDHILDGNGAVVQQGTPLNAQNLNHLEEGVAQAAAFTAGELGAASAYSGVLQHIPEINTGFIGIAAEHLSGKIYAVNPAQQLNNASFPGAINGLRLGPIDALIAGTKLQVVNYGGLTLGVLFYLPNPPTEGNRDDFVFLEAWRDQTTQAWKTRIRTVAGVDFVTFPEGFSKLPFTSAPYMNTLVTPQGGNDVAAVGTVTNWAYTIFRPASYTAAAAYTGPFSGDIGLYVVGDGSTLSKSALKTYDGYSYAIPLFKVNRRNTGGYSVNNPNGARIYKQIGIVTDADGIAPQATETVNLSSGFTTDGITTGERLFDSFGNLYFEVAAVISSTSLSLKNLRSNTVVGSINPLSLPSLRPDGLFANVIAERDITDLRHKTYLVAPSYEQLLIDGTDRILRGVSQVERKTAQRKTYVGVRKTPLDANHVFYASLDSSVIAEVGGAATALGSGAGTSFFVPAPTGSGLSKGNTSNAGREYTVAAGPSTALTIEFWNKIPVQNLNDKGVFLLYNPADGAASEIRITYDNELLYVRLGSDTYRSIISQSALPLNKWFHIRLVIKGTEIRAYIDGQLKNEYISTVDFSTKSYTRLMLYPHLSAGEYSTNSGTFGAEVPLADVAVSKVDRGATFATLPADYIQGYADVTPALNYQRRINSDAQTSQKSFAAVKVKNGTQESGITVTKGAGTNNAAWEAGDKIKVRGLAGELIGGVIDTDTALARVISLSADGFTATLDDVSKLAVNDVFQLWAGGSTRTITAIDATAKTITVGVAMSTSAVGQFLLEITASTSSPVVRAIISGTSTTVTGTWANLGTNEAEVALGTLPGGLAAQEIIIEYSLNTAAGWGGLYQVYSTILGGEANGKKLVLGNTTVTDDFAGKVAGSTTVNPNKAYSSTGSALATPGAPGTELTQADYNAINIQDSSLKVVTTSTNGQQAQIMITVDLIRAYEDKYGKIPTANILEDKKAWLTANTGFTIYAWAYGSGPSGNKATLSYYESSAWAAPISGMVNTTGAITRLSRSLGITTNIVQADGLAHFIIYADASDGVTASSVFLDYFSIDYFITGKTGYDTLMPENARRDSGPAGMLYVRKTTREVESIFPGNDEDNGIVVIGDYLPTQELASSSLSGLTDVLLDMQGFVTVAGTNKAYGTNNAYANAITRLLGPGHELNYKVDPQSLISTVAYDAANAAGILRYFYADMPHSGNGAAGSVYTDGVPTWCKNIADFLVGTTTLLQYNGELLLRIFLRTRGQSAAVGIGGSGIPYYFRLPGRPLIKL